MTAAAQESTADDDDDYTLDDAKAAYGGISALVELLGACKPGQQVTGVFILSLLVDVRMHLESLVSALEHMHNIRP